MRGLVAHGWETTILRLTTNMCATLWTRGLRPEWKTTYSTNL